ncbi:MAG: peptidoglycan-binding domain-containing protein [Clostridia bacterium]|nr:peptidoglycan-binding domain-containing protein [Clostridia bacterium]
MAVKVGSARIDENGKIYGGRAGDQNGKEVSTQSWYKHKKGWRVLRCKSADKAEKIARAMQAACDNANIGYDQYQRLSLYNFAKRVDFDPAKIKTPCETDCSALVRVCLAYAGIMVENFRTPNEASVLLRSGEFVELKEGRYTDQSTYLRRGDILVTRTQGHTVVVLSNGSKAEAAPAEEAPRTILRRGMKGEDVRALQQLLIKRGYALSKYGADGEYGAETERAVRKFQTDHGLESDGEYGPLTRAVLAAEPQPEPGTVQILQNTGVRAGNGEAYAVLQSAAPGASYPYVAASENGWIAVALPDRVGWLPKNAARVT